MGKTKTAFVQDTTEDQNKQSSLDELKAKRERQEALRQSAQGKKEKVEKEEKVHVTGLKGGQRIKVVEAEPLPEDISAPSETETKEKKAKRAPRVRGKKYQEARAKVDRNKTYSVKNAIDLVKATSFSAFDGSVELHLVVKKTGLSANVSLPHAAGREKKIEIADESTIKKLQEGKVDFDVLIATTEMMPKLVPFARILGPKGLMPNPKNGTLVPDLKKAKAFSGNSVTIKTEKDAPLIHTVVGKVSQSEKELEENLQVIVKGVSDKQIVKAYLKATMGPAIKIQF
jgi:large subunit ribosomal protein L1